MSVVQTHPDLLSDEDGEFYWLREDMAAGTGDVLAGINNIVGLHDDELAGYEVAPEPITMRAATLEDVEDGRCSEAQREDGWYFVSDQGDVRYWQANI